MSGALTQRALRVFAILEDYRAGSPDILDALLPFFEPILAEFNGGTLNQEAFALRVREAYRWNFTADIVEELIPRFRVRNWVEEIPGTAPNPGYRVKYDNPIAAPAADSEIKIGQVLLNAAHEFKTFIERISPLSFHTYGLNELSDTLVEWLVSIDAYSEEVLRQKAVQTTNTGGQLGLSVTLQDSTNLSTEERYLCARFVKHLFEIKSPLIADLCKLASVGLLTEVIQDFQKPLSRVDRTGVNIYLDAPVALDLLGVSGKAAAENIRPIIKKLQEIGASVRIFRISVDELQHALDAVLKRTPTERTGPTAEAIRRNEVAEQFVRQVAQDPDQQLARWNIAVFERKLHQYPNEHEYFEQEHYDRLFSKMTWHIELPRREHDTTAIALIMRMRAGSHSRDLFQSKHLLITRNGALSQLAKKFCVDQDLSARNSVGPAIHQRQLATAAWLRTGLGDGTSDVPRRYLLAACERVLELKKSIVDQVRLTARNLTAEKAEQLELLLTQDRSVQVLMDKTLGVSNVVNSTNIESLVDAMKISLTSEIQKDADQRIAATTKDTQGKLRKAHEARREAERQASTLTTALSAIDSEDKRIITTFLDEINTAVRRRKRNVKIGIALIILLIGVLPLLSDSFSGALKFICLVIGGATSATLAFYQLLDRPMGIEQWTQRHAVRRLKETAAVRGMDPKIGRVNIVYKDGFVLMDQQTQGSNSGQLL